MTQLTVSDSSTSNRVSSGISGFDDLLYGGFPKGRSYLIAGEPGTGKTLFTLQFLLDGVKNGENGIYISVDEKPHHVIADARAMGWNLDPYLSSGQLQILDVTKYFSQAKLDENGKIDTNKDYKNGK